MTDSDLPGVPEVTIPPEGLLPQTSAYLETIASDAFKRGVELDESVWRSLPFFSATLALTAAVIGHASTSVPHLTLSTFAILTSIVLAAASAALVWSLRWFWEVIRPRDYEYPAPATDIQLYATALAAYHDDPGTSHDDLDMRVVQDLRSFLIEQYAEAADNNFQQNEIRLKARSSALLWMMAALVLAFACETLIFVHAATRPAPHGTETIDDRTDNASDQRQQDAGSPACAATCGAGQAGRGSLQDSRDCRHSPQAVSDEPASTPAPPPVPAQAPTPVRPQPPAPQILKKNQ